MSHTLYALGKKVHYLFFIAAKLLRVVEMKRQLWDNLKKKIIIPFTQF